MTVQEYTPEELATQPIGYWSGATMRLVVGGIRAELATEDLTQPHWWTLNHVAGAPGAWGRPGSPSSSRPSTTRTATSTPRTAI